ncbi:MAG: 2-C-methyl-D-erythritol 2,4-cyclodiphosphate synthase [Candidatus Sumerlaeia bacterium]|nr:2-C-methyl-D-erythritol 2,4-cyclodiphosphate synthase [Candidatus Sumerlaeia bacterium]
MNQSPPPFAIGQGYDVHQFAPNRRLVLGGVEIPHDRGLIGHSDADVLLHALCDALLGAAGLGDIGHFFPNTEKKWEGADSMELLRLVMEKLREMGWKVGNVDCMLIAEEPKVAPHLPAMKERIAPVLGCEVARVGLKATTNEKMGFVGRGEGIAALAVALIFRDHDS